MIGVFPPRVPRLRLALRLGPVRFVFGVVWIAAVALMAWGVRVLYVPLLGAALSNRDAWLATAAIVGATLAGRFVHTLAHTGVACALHAPLPEELPVYPLGDAAQVWPATGAAVTEAVVAGAGPLADLLLALGAFAIWNTQLDPFWNTVAFFLLVINVGLALINLAPAFPFDGGRVLRALVWQCLAAPALGTTLARRLGLLLLACLLAWSAFLAWQRLSFSGATSLSTLALLALTAFQLFAPPTWRLDRPDERTSRPLASRLLNIALIAVAALPMVGAFTFVLPLNAGLEAPGGAVSVEPMVQAPANLAHRVAGTFMLTTVFPQAPIVVAEWLYAHYDTAILLTTPENIVPPGTTPQEESIQGFRDLQESEKTAIVVGLHLAGYSASLTFVGAEVTGILPTSKARGVLKLGDVITALNGRPVSTPSDVESVLAAAPSATSAQIEVERANHPLGLQVALTPPAAGSARPSIGVYLSPTGDSLSLPFPVTITPRDVVGGPSAGLMFSLTVANALTPADLTGGYRIAGTGSIDLSGAVGAIGGVQQKVAAAEGAGATYFLCPADNYSDARAVARHIEVVQVASAQQALTFLRSLPPLSRRSPHR